MRWTFALVALVLAGCADTGSGSLAADQAAAIERMRVEDARCQAGLSCYGRAGGQAGASAAAAEPDTSTITPTQRARREFDAAKAARENELLERAMTSSPDYTAAVRRAAVANVDGAAALPPEAGARRPATNPRVRETAITAEEARLSDAVEARRRERLGVQTAQRQTQQDQQAAAQCIALGQQVEASMYNHRSLLNLEATATANQARENCWQNYQASRAR